MPDERTSPSGGWRDVYREMGVAPDDEETEPVDLSALVDGDRSSAPDRYVGDERRDASIADD